MSEPLDPRGERGKAQLLAYNEERKERLASIEVTRPILTMEQAQDPEVIEWVNQRIAEGYQWAEIRRMCGLGPASVDPRWRELRKHVIEQAMPDRPDEVLKQAFDEQNEVIHEIRDLLSKIDHKINIGPRTEEEEKTHHNYYKMKLEGLRALLDERIKRISQYGEIQRVKMGPSKSVGVQILIQNNIPRPSKEIRPKDSIRATADSKPIEVKVKGVAMSDKKGGSVE